MYQIDIVILNRALKSLGRLSAYQERKVLEIDEKRRINPYVRLHCDHRQLLKEVGRIFEIYPDQYGPTASVKPLHSSTVNLHHMRRDEFQLDQKPKNGERKNAAKHSSRNNH